MKDNTVLIVALAGVGLYLLSKRRSPEVQQATTPQPTEGTTVGRVAGGWIDSILGGVLNRRSANLVASRPVQTFVSATSPTPASTGAVYNQSQLTGVANLVSAGSNALRSLVNVATNIFGRTTTKPASTPGASEALPSVQVAGGIPGSAISGGFDLPASSGAIEWPEASDWAAYV